MFSYILRGPKTIFLHSTAKFSLFRFEMLGKREGTFKGFGGVVDG